MGGLVSVARRSSPSRAEMERKVMACVRGVCLSMERVAEGRIERAERDKKEVARTMDGFQQNCCDRAGKSGGKWSPRCPVGINLAAGHVCRACFDT